MEPQPIVIAPLLENNHIDGAFEIKKETEEDPDGIGTDDELEFEDKCHIIKQETDFKDDPQGMSMQMEFDTEIYNANDIKMEIEKKVKEESIGTNEDEIQSNEFFQEV